jgi:hypothetical protein
VLNPEEAHAGGPPAGRSWTYRALYPSRALLRQITAEFPAGTAAQPQFGPDALRDREVTALLHRFHRLTESPGSSLLERETHLTRALVLLTNRHALRPTEPRPSWLRTQRGQPGQGVPG